MRSRLAGRETDNVSFHATTRVAQQAPPKTARLIVRVCSKAEQARHLLFSQFTLNECKLLCIMPHAACATCPCGVGESLKILRDFRLQFAGALLLCSVWAAGGAPGPRIGPGLHSTIPAGYKVITLKPSGATVSLIALVECPELEGAQQFSQGLNATIVSAQGVTLRQFPQTFSFRVTATLRKTLIESADGTFATQEDPQQFLMKIWFRLKAYDGLEMHEVQPQAVTMIGVPSDIPYDERVYRVAFDVGKVPVTDRFVLEVLSPEGEKLAHFSLALL